MRANCVSDSFHASQEQRRLERERRRTLAATSNQRLDALGSGVVRKFSEGSRVDLKVGVVLSHKLLFVP